MSTNNFTYKNICVVVHDSVEYYCDECEWYQDVMDTCTECGKELQPNDTTDFVDQDIENWADTLKDKIKGFEVPRERSWTKNEALILGEVQFHKPNGDYFASVYATYKSGYYVGACLDYVVEYTYDDVPRLKTLDKKIETKCNQIAKVLRSFGKEVVKIGQASNGEAFYQLKK